ncbi:hypothetical protein HBI56_146420 [Parastagonospora nodorum]|nr:hypothetical protein HBI10_167280 [Parastagonospora nodorum]KAH5096013.1 hypothetical protein HBH72_144050 [Parastagonospora nodorum]KAH5187681.1 hypothetical protein HBH68_161290 [Parastagonospora nodorum]KAH5501382.1 hypothetical protein HBI29_149720 [Parastagonospora nodorum]KAH6221127.1 hypothetical protein HBI15_114710 [Parastagonospora nodorum]
MTLLPRPRPPPPPPPPPPREKHFFRTLRTATSTSWPGICGAGVWILCFALLLSCGYFGAILALGLELLKMGSHVQCRLPSSDAAFSQKLPVTYTAVDGMRVGDLGEQMGKMNIVLISAIFPLFPILILSLLITLHFCRRGIRNRTGMGWAIFLGVFELGNVVNADVLGVDERPGRWHTRCSLTPSELSTFIHKRHVRWSLGTAAQILSGVACLCSILYFSLAVLAAYKNRFAAQSASIRMDALAQQSPYNEDHLPTRMSTDRPDGPSPALYNTAGAMPVAGLGVGRGRVVVRDV